jgi:alkanesulfonate monooxygenase SsuD/methylene tetrahydromethanopterin reductase-like flavin-dependent oxidoreductase (luciferase family)
MRLSTVILPIHRWSEGRHVWRRAEDLGFHAAYTYDHLSWRSFRDGPWFGTVPTLTAAALATSRIRLGTMVTSPNFRHPVPLAKDLMTIDDVSDGRLTVGVGAGGEGFDATVLGQSAWSRRERADRYAEFVPLLDGLLSGTVGSSTGTYYTAVEARMEPGCVQRPRVPLHVAGIGPRGMALAVRHGQGWITDGSRGPADESPQTALAAVAAQVERLRETCAAAGRDPGELEKVLLFHGGPALESPAAFVDWAAPYRDLGFTELVVHWPVADSVFACDPAVFERIAQEAPAQLA